MNMHRLLCILAGILSPLILCSCAEDSEVEQTAAPVSYSHDPLQYRVKVKYNVTFTYTPKDADDAPEYVIHEFENRLETDGNSGNGYEMADGETPNLTLQLTFHSDDSDNKTMEVYGYASDGYFYTKTDNSYQDAVHMIDAIADEVNGFVSGGWSGTR
jgi:hypothetical protein